MPALIGEWMEKLRPETWIPVFSGVGTTGGHPVYRFCRFHLLRPLSHRPACHLENSALPPPFPLITPWNSLRVSIRSHRETRPRILRVPRRCRADEDETRFRPINFSSSRSARLGYGDYRPRLLRWRG